MAIKRVTLNTLTFLVNEIKERYTEKTEIGALGHLDKVAVEHLAEDLKNLINGKANAATTLAGYGITDGMTATEIAQAISTAVAGADHLSRVTVSSTADINVSAPDAEKKSYSRYCKCLDHIRKDSRRNKSYQCSGSRAYSAG